MTETIRRFLFLTGILLALAHGAAAENSHTGQNSAPLTVAGQFRDIARHQNPSVVSIVARSYGRHWEPEEEEMFHLFGVVPPEPDRRLERRVGSGFVISETGEILTNNHVISGADFIEVTLFGDEHRRYRASLVGRDPVTDCAVIRLENPPPNLHPVTLGDSSTLEPGDWVMAIGDPFELGHTVTAGLVSFERRPFQMRNGEWQDMIQTDASLNPGNSGGPLLDLKGDVVGINVAVLDTNTGRSPGIGFAIPINTVKALLPQLRRGQVTRGHLAVRFHGGVILEDEARLLGLPHAAGALIMSVDAGSTAARSGLLAGDVIVAIDGLAVDDARALMAHVSTTPPGTKAALTLFRGGVKQTRTIAIEKKATDPDETDEVDLRPHDSLGGLTLYDLATSASARNVPRGVDGALVVYVTADSPADEAEIEAGDIIRAINGHAIHGAAGAIAALSAIRPHTPIFLLVWREGVELFLQMRAD